MPAIDEVGCRRTRSRRSSAPIVCSFTPAAAGQKILPITEQRRSASRESASSRSIRAAMTPWIESGRGSSASASVADQPSPRCSSAPCSISMCSSSSTKNGLPSELASTRSRTASGAPSSPSSDETSCAAFSPSSGASVRAVAFCFAAPHVGRLSRSSMRAVQTIRTEAPASASASPPSRSRSGADPQWRSSMARIVRPSCPSAVT